jgi:hypothetical protein
MKIFFTISKFKNFYQNKKLKRKKNACFQSVEKLLEIKSEKDCLSELPVAVSSEIGAIVSEAELFSQRRRVHALFVTVPLSVVEVTSGAGVLSRPRPALLFLVNERIQITADLAVLFAVREPLVAREHVNFLTGRVLNLHSIHKPIL